MSKLRSQGPNFRLHPSRSRLLSLISSPKHKQSSDKDNLQVTRIFQQTRCKTITSDKSQLLKDSLYNKNISQFRESFMVKDANILPFLASLRNIKDYRKIQIPKGINPVAFNAERQTHNQKIKKRVNDIKAHPFRLSKVYYRWNQKSGQGIKEVCEFQCSLRMNKKSLSLKNPQQSNFNNTIMPIRLKTVEAPQYKASDLICERQKRLFTLEDNDR